MTDQQSVAEVVVDLAAIRHNVARLATLVAPSQVMVVVKANGYGHGMLPVARAARAAGAQWLGVALLSEALALRDAGDAGSVLAWLAVPGQSYAEAIDAGIELTASSTWQLAEIVSDAAQVQRAARVQLKADTGLSRNGATPSDWPELVAAARQAQDAGAVSVTGLWSHFACADEMDHPSLTAQETAFARAVSIAAAAGLTPTVTHLANSPAALTRPSSRLSLVRTGLAAYGLSPVPAQAAPSDLGLRPAMTVRACLAGVKRVPAGTGVSYGHTHVTDRETTLGLVPLGYGDGVLRASSNRAEVWVAGRRRPVVGRICMDQFVVDLGGDTPAVGSEVVLFGPGDHGEPTAQDWADSAGTISYEVVTRIGGRAARVYVDEEAP
ncbi:MAG: alanine racemase [Nocardioidaceae bacterium]